MMAMAPVAAALCLGRPMAGRLAGGGVIPPSSIASGLFYQTHDTSAGRGAANRVEFHAEGGPPMQSSEQRPRVIHR
jgi:hypothetical protein